MSVMNPTGHREAPRQADVDAALLLLERMGLSPADLQAVSRDRPHVPTSPNSFRSCRRRSRQGPVDTASIAS
jgi:hypothetical protein